MHSNIWQASYLRQGWGFVIIPKYNGKSMTQIIGAKNKLIPFRKMMVFVDGENMVFCYQKLLKNGRAPCKFVKHEKDVYVWDKNTIKNPGAHNIIRVYYYTYATGSDETIKRIRKDIKSLEYLKHSDDSLSPNNLYPIVFKKEKKRGSYKRGRYSNER